MRYDSSMQESVLRINGLTKTYGARIVVNDVSFDVRRGEMFGFLGPNGSGKTTTVRMVLGIIQPDHGTVGILGSPPDWRALKGVGYLPEERGLPWKGRVLDAVRYLGRLKGLTFTEAEARAGELLKRVGLYEHRGKKVEALSPSMTQLVQFVTAIVHDPEVIILDKPFSWLDPMNVAIMKEMLFERQRAGATIMFSTHVASDIEDMCQRVALIVDSRLALLGDLAEIKRQRGAKSMQVHARGVPDGLANDGDRIIRDGVVEYAMEDGNTPNTILKSYVDAGIDVERFELSQPSLSDIFSQEVARARAVP